MLGVDSSFTVQNCKVIRNRLAAQRIEEDENLGVAGICIVRDQMGATIRNCVVARNHGGGVGVKYPATTDVDVVNCTVLFNGRGPHGDY